MTQIPIKKQSKNNQPIKKSGIAREGDTKIAAPCTTLSGHAKAAPKISIWTE